MYKYSFPPCAGACLPASAELQPPAGAAPRPSVLLVGNPALPLKGFDTAIAALALVNQSLPIEVGAWGCLDPTLQVAFRRFLLVIPLQKGRFPNAAIVHGHDSGPIPRSLGASLPALLRCCRGLGSTRASQPCCWCQVILSCYPASAWWLSFQLGRRSSFFFLFPGGLDLPEPTDPAAAAGVSQ